MRPQPHPLTYILPVLGMAAAWVLLTAQGSLAPLFFRNSLAFWYPFVVAIIICGFTWEAITRLDPAALSVHDANGNEIFDLSSLRRYSPIERTRFLDYIEDKIAKK